MSFARTFSVLAFVLNAFNGRAEREIIKRHPGLAKLVDQTQPEDVMVAVNQLNSLVSGWDPTYRFVETFGESAEVVPSQEVDGVMQAAHHRNIFEIVNKRHELKIFLDVTESDALLQLNELVITERKRMSVRSHEAVRVVCSEEGMSVSIMPADIPAVTWAHITTLVRALESNCSVYSNMDIFNDRSRAALEMLAFGFRHD